MKSFHHAPCNCGATVKSKMKLEHASRGARGEEKGTSVATEELPFMRAGAGVWEPSATAQQTAPAAFAAAKKAPAVLKLPEGEDAAKFAVIVDTLENKMKGVTIIGETSEIYIDVGSWNADALKGITLASADGGHKKPPTAQWKTLRTKYPEEHASIMECLTSAALRAKAYLEKLCVVPEGASLNIQPYMLPALTITMPFLPP